MAESETVGTCWKLGQEVEARPISVEGRKDDAVSYPAHYTRFPGIEVIQLTEHLNFCRGNAVKYIARAGSKRDEGGKSIADKEIEDLEKARWYLDREITRLKGKGG